MELNYSSNMQITLPNEQWRTIVEHCQRKLAASYIEGEACEKKAYGLVAGTMTGDMLTVRQCFPLLKNARAQAPYKKIMDETMSRHAVPSETPLDKRGWVADPAELLGKIKICHSQGLKLFGTYHMHRVAWGHDQLRDTPTSLDTILAAGSKLVVFIISMIDPAQPLVRAYYEGIMAKEIPLTIT